MSITYQVLGKPGRDNALITWINSGNRLYRILFDCGENLLNNVKQSDIKSVDFILFSHLHIDHVAGFDYFFRRNYLREEPIRIWGPGETAAILHNRFRGYIWNLVDDLPGTWYVTDISKSTLKTFCYRTADSYKNEYFIGETPNNGLILENEDFSINAIIMNHIIPSIGYSITEKSSFNIDKEKLIQINIEPGPWLEKVKDLSLPDDSPLIISGKEINLGELRKKLLVSKKGEKISYLTDFLFDESTIGNIIEMVRGSDILVCESQYSESDHNLAKQNYHLTSKQSASIAKAAGVKKLILFHISERYLTSKNYPDLLKEAREIFPETYFPEKW
jgi:ribonuclease Z